MLIPKGRAFVDKAEVETEKEVYLFREPFIGRVCFVSQRGKTSKAKTKDSPSSFSLSLCVCVYGLFNSITQTCSLHNNFTTINQNHKVLQPSSHCDGFSATDNRKKGRRN
jgi:hypothetical protein